MSKADWRWVPSEKTATGLGYLTRLLLSGNVCVDIYGGDPTHKDSEELFRSVAAKIDAHDALAAACEAMLMRMESSSHHVGGDEEVSRLWHEVMEQARAALKGSGD